MPGIDIFNGIVNNGGIPSGGAGLLANRPAAGVVGRLFIGTDTNLWYRDTGTAWVSISGTGTVTGTGTAGQAAFWSSGTAISGDNTFFWDNTNKRLGLGTATPGVRLDIHGTGVLQQLNGTTTNSAYLDFLNAGTTQFRIGNDYNGGANTFNIFNNSLSDYSYAVIKSSGVQIFGSPSYNLFTSTYKFNFINTSATTESVRAMFSYKNVGNGGNSEYYFATRGTSVGAYSATLNGDILHQFSILGSSASTFINGSDIYFRQNGAVGISAPVDIEFRQWGSTGTASSRLWLRSAGFSTFLDRLNVNNATDNALFELNVNGNTYTGGISPTILTVGVNTNMARTATGYYCTAAITLTLPTASGLNNWYIVIASGSAVTVQRNGTDTILDKTGASVTSVTVAANTRSMFYVGGGTVTFQIF